jgi:predicted DNA-binding protein
MKICKRRETTVISFRIKSKYAERIKQLAQRNASLTLSEWLRQMVEKYLEDYGG